MLTRNDNKYQELTELVLYCLEGEAAPEDRAKLEQMLSASPDLLGHYCDILVIYSGIHKPGASLPIMAESAAESLPETEELLRDIISRHHDQKYIHRADSQQSSSVRVSSRPSSRRPGPHDVVRTAQKIAALLIVSFTLVFLDRHFIQNTGPKKEELATITQQSDAVWAEQPEGLAYGALFAGDRLQLVAGYICVEFHEGTQLFLEGPVDLHLESGKQIYLNQGYVSVTVSKNVSGFTVRTNNATVVDYGTRFSVHANENRETAVHVLEGRVDLRNSSDPRVFENSQRLVAGQSGRVDSKNELSLMVNDESQNLALYDVPSIWEADGADGNWSDPANWSQGRIPGRDSICKFNIKSTHKISVIDEHCVGRQKAVAKRVNVGLYGGGACYLNMTGGEAEFRQLWIGRLEGAEGYMTMKGGTLRLSMTENGHGLLIGDNGYGRLTLDDGKIILESSSLKIGMNKGRGEMIVNGGTVIVGQNILIGENGHGVLQISGGVVFAGSIVIKNGLCEIGGNGRLILDGDHTDELQGYINSNVLQMMEDTGRLHVIHDKDNRYGFGVDKTIVNVSFN